MNFFSENVFLVHSMSTRKQIAPGVQGYVLSFASQRLRMPKAVGQPYKKGQGG